MQEIATGVYVGNFNVKIREELWKRVLDSVGVGEATLSYSTRNEIGYEFKTHNTSTVVLDCEGIPLVMKKIKEDKVEEKKLGFSNVSKMHKSKKFQGKDKKTKNKKIESKTILFLDIETNGLSEIDNDIIEIGALKINGNEIKTFQSLIKNDEKMPIEIIKLTGITDEDLKSGDNLKNVLIKFLEFIDGTIIVGYNINFDIKFLNKKLEKEGLSSIHNKIYDLMDFVKKDNQFLEDYKLQTALLGYGIEKKIPHRALEDAKLCYELSTKMNKFQRFIEKI